MKRKYPGMIIHCIGVAFASILLVSSMINTIWPDIEENQFKKDINLNSRK